MKVKKTQEGREFLHNFGDWFQFITDVQYHKTTNIINEMRQTSKTEIKL